MTRNIVLCLLCLTSPALAAGEVEDCIARHQLEIEDVRALLFKTEGELLRGFRDHQPDLTGLDATEERYNRWVRDPHGRPRTIVRSRWHYTDATGKAVTLLNSVEIDREAWQARADSLSDRLTLLHDGYPAKVAACRSGVSDH